MLNGVLQLHDIRDVEAFTATILKRKGINIDEDTHSYLIEECWILSRNYNPTQGSRFSAWAKLTLERRLIDRTRQTHGDHRYKTGRQRPTLTPLTDHLAETLTASPLDDPQHRSTDLQRLLRSRPSQNERPYNTMDTSTTRRAA